ncbi:MAG: hypothetical protein ACTSXC_07910 [Candidatus Freyarchaeota archaeon]
MERIRKELSNINILDLAKILSVAVMIVGFLTSLYLFLKGDYLFTVIIGVLSVTPIVLFTRFRRVKRVKKGLDLTLVTVITHMYCLSLGNMDAKGLVGGVAKNREYGVYSRVFTRIMTLATKFGYGFTKAIRLMTRTVKPPLRDILIRFSEAIASRVPKEHLGLEMSTVTEEYTGEYEHMVESMKVLGGIYASLISISALAVMVSSLLTIFLENVLIPVIAYILAVSVLIMMLVALKMASPNEKVVYVGKSPPKTYSLFKLSSMLAVVALALPVAIVVTMGYEGIAYMLVSAGGILIGPGLLAYKLESYVGSIDKFYPAFIKVLGENLSSTTDFKSALSYGLHMEFGPLKRHVQRALNRIKSFVNAEEALNLMASETASYHVHMLNNIFTEAFKAGSNPLEVGKILSSLAIKVMDLRNKRRVVTRSFQTVLVILQPIVVALLVILTALATFFSQTITKLPYFELGYIPVPLVRYGTMALIIVIAALNSLSINLVRGGFKGTSLLYAGLLLIESGIAWIGASTLMDMLLGHFASGIEFPF